MITYIVRRLFQLVLVLIGVSMITFAIMFLIPGDPAVTLAGKGATPETVAMIRHRLALDKPVYVQYGMFVERLLHGDLGESYQTNRPVSDMIREALPNTAQLAIAAVLIELLGIPLGIYSALRQFTFWDTALTTVRAHHLGHPRLRPGPLHAVVLRAQAQPVPYRRRRRRDGLVHHPGGLLELLRVSSYRRSPWA